jgi:hypothetical protein
MIAREVFVVVVNKSTTFSKDPHMMRVFLCVLGKNSKQCYNRYKSEKQQSLQRPYNKVGLLQNKLTSIALSVIL